MPLILPHSIPPWWRMKKRAVLVAARYPIGAPMTAPAETPPVEPTAPATPPPSASPAPSPASMPQSQPPVAAAPTTEPGEVTGEPAESPDLAKLRKENASWRTRLREQETASAALNAEREQERAAMKALQDQFAAIGAIFNPDANQPPDPALLAEQLQAAQAETALISAAKDQEIRNLTIRASLPNVLAKAHADPTLTEAVLTATGALGKLDPSSDTFIADLELAVSAAMEANPRLKMDAPVAPSKRSGAEIPGRSGGSTQLTREEVTAMAKIPGALDKAFREGRMKSLGAG